MFSLLVNWYLYNGIYIFSTAIRLKPGDKNPLLWETNGVKPPGNVSWVSSAAVFYFSSFNCFLCKKNISHWKKLFTLRCFGFIFSWSHWKWWKRSLLEPARRNPIALLWRSGNWLGTLRTHDDGGNGKVKNNRFNEQNNNSARASRFFVQFLPSLHNYQVKWPNFKFTLERQGDKFYHLCPNLSAFPSLQLQPKCPSFK